MMYSRLLLAAVLPGVISTLPTLDPAAFNPSSIIQRDVCIIGGGSSGTYGAIRLHDQGKSIVVVEAQNQMGGHTQTYIDPTTNLTVDYGVLLFNNIQIVKDYFARFNVPLKVSTTASPPGEVTSYVDFKSGEVVAGYVPSDISAALTAYGAQVAKYPYLETGFDLPDLVPSDLLLSTEDFFKKYSLEALVDFAVNFAQGSGNLLSKPAIYLMKYIGLGVLENFHSGFLVSSKNDTSELYEKAQAELGQDVLLSSKVIATDRSGEGAKILVQTPDGVKLILTKKMLLSVPPLLSNLQGFDLDTNETSLFNQFLSNGYWTGLMRNSNMPDNLRLQNTGANTLYNQPVFPGAYGITPTIVSGLHKITYGSLYNLSDERVKANIVADVDRLTTAGTLDTTSPEFAVFSSHTPFESTVPSNVIAAGFYRKLYALQGQQHTYYTGAAFHAHDSALLWRFTEGLLPEITASL